MTDRHILLDLEIILLGNDFDSQMIVWNNNNSFPRTNFQPTLLDLNVKVSKGLEPETKCNF